MSVNTCLIYRCLSSASAVIRSWFIYELQKSTTIAFSRNSLYTFYSRNPTCGIPPCLRISNRKYPPCPQNSIIVNPPSPSEILKAVRRMVWIFSGIAHLRSVTHTGQLSQIWHRGSPLFHTGHHVSQIKSSKRWLWFLIVCTSCKTSYNVLSHSRVCTVLESPWIIGEVLEKSLNFLQLWM